MYGKEEFLKKFAEPGKHYGYDDAPHAYLTRSKHVSEDDINKALESPNADISEVAMQRHDCTANNILTGLSHPDWYIRCIAAQHSNASKEDIEDALADRHHAVRRHATMNPNYTKFFPDGH